MHQWVHLPRLTTARAARAYLMMISLTPRRPTYPSRTVCRAVARHTALMILIRGGGNWASHLQDRGFWVILHFFINYFTTFILLHRILHSRWEWRLMENGAAWSMFWRKTVFCPTPLFCPCPKLTVRISPNITIFLVFSRSSRFSDYIQQEAAAWDGGKDSC